MPSTFHSVWPKCGASLTAHLVYTPRPPRLPSVPRQMPRTDGPGPSLQNQPSPEPSEPVRTISPSGVTHSMPSTFSALPPM